MRFRIVLCGSGCEWYEMETDERLFVKHSQYEVLKERERCGITVKKADARTEG